MARKTPGNGFVSDHNPALAGSWSHVCGNTSDVAHATSIPDPRPQTSPGDAPPAIELVGVHKRFGAVHALRGIDLTIRSGEIAAFLGPNGAGKTTTIDVILGLSDPTEGTAKVYGMKPAEAISRGLVSAVMQTGGLLKDFTL